MLRKSHSYKCLAKQSAEGRTFSESSIRHQLPDQQCVYRGGLNEKSNVQKMHIANSDKPEEYFSLDVIISCGYLVKSSRGTSSVSGVTI